MYFIDILQVLTEISRHIRCWNQYQAGKKQISQIGCTSIGWACISTEGYSDECSSAWNIRKYCSLADNFCKGVQDAHAEHKFH